ncbi:MAG TPA: class I SAM-dependent RNA methyltransferase [Bryobacteraceae bacterium]|nr:class I SAM-dependent RNA methyltransferase [Bryobacteraceae bacterium]
MTSIVEIEKLVHGGEGLARQDGQVVLVPYVLPGETVSVTTGRVKNGLLRGSAPEVLVAAPERIVPRCDYFADCGGCHLQHATYDFQLAQKRAILLETLQRIGGVRHEGEVVMLSGEPWFYRNRVQLHFERGKCGFHRAGSHEVRPIDHCYIASPLLVEAIAKLHDAVKRPEWPAFLRSLELFTNESELQVNIVDSTRPVAARFFEWLKTLLPSFAAGAIEYRAGEESYRISRGSFFQTNRFLIDALIEEVLADATGRHAADLYAGVGLFSVPLAKRFTQLDAVERGGPAFRDLEWNATRSGASHLTPRRAAAEDFLRELEAAPEFVLADPPRAGLGKETTHQLLRLKPPRLTIVSCDAATLARDLRALLAGGYGLKRLALIDLFPQTYHFETVAHLKWQAEA